MPINIDRSVCQQSNATSGANCTAANSSWLEVAAVALFSIGAQLFISQALVCIPAPKVSVMMTAEVPLVTVFGVLYLGEPIGWRLRVGALLIFGSGIGLNLRPDRSTSN